MLKCKYCGRTYVSDKVTLCEGCGAAISLEDKLVLPAAPVETVPLPPRKKWTFLPVLWEVFCGLVLFILLVSQAWQGAIVFAYLGAAGYLLTDAWVNRERYRQMNSPLHINVALLCWLLFCVMMELIFLSMGYPENMGVFTLVGLLSLTPYLWKLSRRYLFAR
ncbi:MAG: hypothetical protein ACK5LX_15270 [Oscillospiraceae bacterium]